MRSLGHPIFFRITFAFMVLLLGLSALIGPASRVLAVTVGQIPDDAIRIRIIANSDSAFDQKVKRDVRDRVASVIESWGAMPSSHDQARALIEAHLPEIEETAHSALREWGAAYGAEIKLGKVAFPDKMFEGRSYTAGDYEALRITLGGGVGANWWCVLFPPLCLTAATAPDDQTASGGSSDAPVHTSAKAKKAGGQAETEPDPPEARFFLWEMFQKLGAFLKSFFS